MVTPDGHVVGALAVADRQARRLEPAERTALENLAALAMARLEARCATAPGIEAFEAGERAEEAEERLAREREFTDAVIQSLPGSFFLISRDGEMLRWNARMQAATGYTGLEIAAMRPLSFIAPADRAAVEAAIREVLEHGREFAIEAQMLDKAGLGRPYVFTGKPLRVGGEMYVMGFGRDITERKRAEEQTLRAKERLDLALSGSSLALWDWDLRSNRLYFNEGWTRSSAIAQGSSRSPGRRCAAGTTPRTRICTTPRWPTRCRG